MTHAAGIYVHSWYVHIWYVIQYLNSGHHTLYTAVCGLNCVGVNDEVSIHNVNIL